MSDPQASALAEIDPTVGKKCGNCEFGEPVANDLTKVECFGVPPTPISIPMKDALGRPGLFMQPTRCQLPKSCRGCALWAPRPLFDLSRLKQPAGKAD